jgi:hypothetical protein
MRAPCPVHMSSRDMLKHYFSPNLRLALTTIGLHIVELHTHIAAIGVRQVKTWCAAVVAGARLDCGLSNLGLGLGDQR